MVNFAPLSAPPTPPLSSPPVFLMVDHLLKSWRCEIKGDQAITSDSGPSKVGIYIIDLSMKDTFQGPK